MQQLIIFAWYMLTFYHMIQLAVQIELKSEHSLVVWGRSARAPVSGVRQGSGPVSGQAALPRVPVKPEHDNGSTLCAVDRSQCMIMDLHERNTIRPTDSQRRFRDLRLYTRVPSHKKQRRHICPMPS